MKFVKRWNEWENLQCKKKKIKQLCNILPCFAWILNLPILNMERQTCIAISKIHSSTIYFVPFNRLTTTNLIHQGVNVQRFFTVAQLFVRLFFSCALQTLGGWPHFLGFQMTWHFFLSFFCIFLYSCAIFPRWFQCSVCSMLMLPKGSVNKHTWAVLLARIIFHYALVDVVGVGFFLFLFVIAQYNNFILFHYSVIWSS